MAINFERNHIRLVVVLGLLATWVAVGIYAYLGTFSRYFADDYCEAVRVTRDLPLTAVFDRYLAGSTRASNRYSNLFFVGMSEMLGSQSIPITIVAMMLLWCLGLSWCVHELRRYFKIHGAWSLDLFLGATLGFFSFLQAPNLFQSVLWRSAMMTHFAPLVLGALLLAYIVRQFNVLQERLPARMAYAVVFISAFVMAGFSEPPLTTWLTGLPLVMGAIWFFGKDPIRKSQLALLSWTFAGVFLGFLALAFSPASLNIAESRRMDISVLIGNSFYYSYLFIIDSLKIMPVPVAINLILPGVWFWLENQTASTQLTRSQLRVMLLVMVAIPFLMWLLIAAGFAPSVYGQNFPVERMRFLARTIMIVAVMVEGLLLGYVLKDVRLPYQHAVGQWLAVGVFAAVSVVYPLRAAWNVYQHTIPEHRAHAERWDQRDAAIRNAVAAGETDLVVTQLDSLGGALEYKGDARSWVNVCAASYYGANSIVAP